MTNYTDEQYAQAQAAFRSVCGRGEKDLQEGTLRGFNWSRQRYVEEWLYNVYGSGMN